MSMWYASTHFLSSTLVLIASFTANVHPGSLFTRFFVPSGTGSVSMSRQGYVSRTKQERWTWQVKGHKRGRRLRGW
ncbi:hypothetical protein EDD18DRAFT_1177894 [Armillaria luteobubalina]|uniref:Secreted protein n=1 Tax=Armillaria luteobubalina TaxID=153913 RepID=A0AA39Q3J2_9AGAR|nr:hypothetical protein EDD18DRAFT_1177894 [Armillaria luteobubalina]